jgi:hypothetical protein
VLQALQDGLRQQAWVDGHNLNLEIRLAEGRLDRLTGLVDELARLPVDVMRRTRSSRLPLLGTQFQQFSLAMTTKRTSSLGRAGSVRAAAAFGAMIVR